MKRIQCTVTYPSALQHPLHEHVVADGPLSKAVLLMWSPTADATTLIWCDGDPAATAAAVDAIDSPLRVVYGERDTTADWEPVVERARGVGAEVVELSSDHHFVGQDATVGETVGEFLVDRL